MFPEIDHAARVPHEGRKDWLEEEYKMLREQARPLLKEHAALLERAAALEMIAEDVAQRAYGTLLALGIGEVEARKELKTWRKPAE